MGQWYRTDKASGDREPVTEAHATAKLSTVYHYVALAMAAAKKAGIVLATDLAFYDYKEDRP